MVYESTVCISTVYNVHCTLYIVPKPSLTEAGAGTGFDCIRCTVYGVYKVLIIVLIYCTMYNVQYTVYIVQCTCARLI